MDIKLALLERRRIILANHFQNKAHAYIADLADMEAFVTHRRDKLSSKELRNEKSKLCVGTILPTQCAGTILPTQCAGTILPTQCAKYAGHSIFVQMFLTNINFCVIVLVIRYFRLKL